MNWIADNTIYNSVNAVFNMNFNLECEFDYHSSDDNILAGIASNTRHIETKYWIIKSAPYNCLWKCL